MNAPSDPLNSKGMKLVAAYRAERLSQRPVLRASLRQSHADLRHSRTAGQRPDVPVPATAPPPPPPGNAAPEIPVSASVFANLISLEVAERLEAAVRADAEQAVVPDDTPATEPVAATPDPAMPDTLTPDPMVTDSAATDPSRGSTAPEPEPPFDPPLAEIGFGPGMLIRLSQVGLHTTGDLAQADPSLLRAELGDISRLVDVETWIAAARQKTRAGR